MIELLLAFIIPGISYLVATYLGYSQSTAILVALLVLVLQFVVFMIVATIAYVKARRDSYPAFMPPCRCGSELNQTLRKAGYRCPECNRRYIQCGGPNLKKFVEKLDSGYTLAYMNTVKWGKWEADIPDCRCGRQLKQDLSSTLVESYLCKCGQKFQLIPEPGFGIRFVELVADNQIHSYMKSVRWDRWESDEG